MPEDTKRLADGVRFKTLAKNVVVRAADGG